MIKLFSKTLNILDLNTKKYSLIIVFLMVLSGILEVLGIGMVIPLFTVILNSGTSTNPYILNYLSLFSNYSYSKLLLINLSILTLVFLVKNFFLAFVTKIQMSFVFKTQVQLSTSLFRKYLFDDFERQTNTNINNSLNLIIYEVGSFTSVLTSILNLISESISFFFIAVVLLILQPIGTISTVVIFISLISIFQKITKNKIERFASVRLENDAKRVQVIKESLEGLKELKILNVEEYFFSMYRDLSIISSDANAKQNTLQQLPRFWTEFIAIFCLSSLIIILDILKYDSSEIFILVSMYALAAFRFIPSANRILSAFQTLNFLSPVIDILHNEFIGSKDVTIKKDETEFTEYISFENSLNVNNVFFNYINGVEIFNNFSFKIRKGKTVGIIGKSGSGKSTLIGIILGILKPKSGSVTIDDVPLKLSNIGSFQKIIGYVPQKPVMLNDSIRNNIALGLEESIISDDRITEVISISQCDEFINKLPHNLNTIIGDGGSLLSGGQCQRLAIARALYHNPKILIFDESTSALDTKTEEDILSTISSFKKEKTIIFITHRPQTLSICDEFIDLSLKS
jgi:ABC-type bacteriocin/lantibiotic exporter with double-glycine peptidase domain